MSPAVNSYYREVNVHFSMGSVFSSPVLNDCILKSIDYAENRYGVGLALNIHTSLNAEKSTLAGFLGINE